MPCISGMEIRPIYVQSFTLLLDDIIQIALFGDVLKMGSVITWMLFIDIIVMSRARVYVETSLCWLAVFN